MAERKLTFQALLEENGVSFADFYESCLHVPGEVISILYKEDLSTQWHLEKIVKHLNHMTGKEYSIEDVGTKQLYGE
jgi:hypothetical protein